MLRRRLLIALSAPTVLAVLAGTADAATYCVQAPACAGTAKTTLADAAAAANANPGLDRIELGPGEFTGQIGFPAGQAVEIAGAGRGAKVITGKAGGPVAVLGFNAPGSSASDLSIRMPDDAGTTTGVDRNATGSLSRVDVEDPTTRASRAGVILRGGGTLEDVEVGMALGTVPVNYGIVTTGTSGAQPTTLTGVRATGGYAIHATGASGAVTMLRSVARGSTYGVAVEAPATLAADGLLVSVTRRRRRSPPTGCSRA